MKHSCDPTPPAADHRMHGGGMEAVERYLINLAFSLGVDAAAIIDVRKIVVDDRLAGLCRDPGCPNYGLAASCPPHVGGPDQFRQWQRIYDWAVIVKMDVPTRTLLGDARHEAFRRLHDVAASIERGAIDSGCTRAMAFAGGSCKGLFCVDSPACRVVADQKPCRHPDRARPSMSGFGVDVARMMVAAGWKMTRVTHASGTDTENTAPITALVLVD